MQPETLDIKACAGLSTAGDRPFNEDLAWVDPSRGVFLVADGSGGPGRGDLAGSLLLEALNEESSALAALRRAHERMVAAIQQAPEKKGMGATVALAVVGGARVDVHHVGDVRAYLLREGVLTQLTEDHTLAAQMVRLNQLSPEAAATHAARKVMTRYLGKDGELKVASSQVQVEPGDVLLLCTDGVYSALPGETLARLGAAPTSDELSERVSELVQLARTSGDNTSLVAVRFGSPAPLLAAPIQVSADLRALVSSLLLASDPTNELARVAADMVRLVRHATGASDGGLVFSEHGRLEALPATELDATVLAALHEALATGQPAHQGDLLAMPVGEAGQRRMALWLRLAGQVNLEALAPYLELLAWLEPLSRVATLAG